MSSDSRAFFPISKKNSSKSGYSGHGCIQHRNLGRGFLPLSLLQCTYQQHEGKPNLDSRQVVHSSDLQMSHLPLLMRMVNTAHISLYPKFAQTEILNLNILYTFPAAESVSNYWLDVLRVHYSYWLLVIRIIHSRGTHLTHVHHHNERNHS